MSNISSPKRSIFAVSDLELVAKAEDFVNRFEPRLRIGDVVALNSGGPRMLVVDVTGDGVTAAWYDSEGIVQENSLPIQCFHRLSVL